MSTDESETKADLVRKWGEGALLDLRPALLYLVVRERNAWHGTRSLTHFRSVSLNTFQEEAQASAQKRRGPGSQFAIWEVPGLAAISTNGMVLTAEIHSRECFGRWNEESGRGLEHLRVGRPVGEAISALSLPWYWKGAKPSDAAFVSRESSYGFVKPLPPRRPFRGWKTNFDRGQIWWHRVVTPDALRYKRGGVNRIRAAFLRGTEAEVRDEAARDADIVLSFGARPDQSYVQQSFLGPVRCGPRYRY